MNALGGSFFPKQQMETPCFAKTALNYYINLRIYESYQLCAPRTIAEDRHISLELKGVFLRIFSTNIYLFKVNNRNISKR